MKPVLIIAAVPQETKLLEQALRNIAHVTTPGFTTAMGALGTLPVVICVAGVGKINAAAATATLIERHQPQLVINAGCAGAYPGNGLAIGDLAVASVEILGDEGVITSNGWMDLQEMNLPYLTKGSQRYFNEIPLSRHAAQKAMHLADYLGVGLTRGRFVTVSSCSGSLLQGEELAQRCNAIAENMEGAAVALVCLRYGVDCLEIRGISNLVEERNMGNWNIPRAVEAAQRFVLKYLEDGERTEPMAW
ncbi:MAG: futalosine hydrolase [Desulfuromonadales bacterium]|nr:futalosine hydrolase [Desulfuromonadales bacterium]